MTVTRRIKNTVAAKGRLPCGRPLPKTTGSAKTTAALLKSSIARLDAYCDEEKLNRSEAREKVLETIVRERRHFTALDLLGRLQDRFPEIGKATMYRTLPILVQSGILREGPHDQNGHVLYELSEDDHHDHIVCLDCRRIFEFHDRTIEKRQDRISTSLRFTPRDHRHVIFAACDYLRENDSAS